MLNLYKKNIDYPKQGEPRKNISIFFSEKSLEWKKQSVESSLI